MHQPWRHSSEMRMEYFVRQMAPTVVLVYYLSAGSAFKLKGWVKITIFCGFMSQVVILQTAQTWANAGVCGGLCACAVGGTFD